MKKIQSATEIDMTKGHCGMRLRYCFFLLIFIVTIYGCSFSRQSGQAQDDTQRVLFHRADANGNFGYATIQTSVITLANSEGSGRICLFSMFHIGEKQYYENLEPLLRQADIILYESMTKAEGTNESAVREVDIIERKTVELYTRLADLYLQHLWEYPLMENDSRWKCIDLPRSQFYAYLDENKIDLKPSLLRVNLLKLQKLEQKKAGETSDALRRSLLRDVKTMTKETCCYRWLPKKDRRIVHRFIHTKRDANFLSQVVQEAREHPKSTIAVLLGARHIMPLKERLEAEHGFEEIDIRWFDVIKIYTGGTAQSNKKEKRL